MKNKMISSIAILFAIGAGILITMNSDFNINADNETEKNTIEVYGLSNIKATPDTAEITIGVRTEEKTAKEAQQKNAEKMEEVVKNIKDIGINDEDIKTQNYSIYPNYDWIERKNSSNERVITGYTVNNSVVITMKDLDKVSKIIDSSVASGANTTRNIRFKIEDTDELYNEALKEAMQNAKSKASAIAESINVKIDKPSKVIENSYNNSTPVYYENSMARMDMAKSASTPIEPGTQNIEGKVKVVFEY